MILPDYTSYRTFLGPKRTPGPSKVGPGDLTVPHFQNFFKAMRSRNPGELAAGPKELHYSSALPHFANISYRTGRELRFDSKTEKFIGNDDANRPADPDLSCSVRSAGEGIIPSGDGK